MNLSRIWYGTDPASTVCRLALVPASWLYVLGWQGYRAIYALSFKKPKHPHSPIVCIGNLTVGGMGKTPLTVFIARLLVENGFKVVISASGYGSPKAEAASVADGGKLDPKVWGDEPTLLRSHLPEVPMIVGRRRVLAAELAQKHFPEHVLLMDDGFQHLPLQKDLTILIDPSPRNGFCLPAGPYREPRSNRKRADLALPSDKFKIVSSTTAYVNESGAELEHGATISVLTAIENPERLLEALSAFKILKTKLLGDHDPLDKAGLFEDLSGPIVVTGKDWVKLASRTDLPPDRVFIAQHESSIEPRAEFAAWLCSRLKVANA